MLMTSCTTSPCVAIHETYLALARVARHQPYAVTDVHVDSWHGGNGPAGECDLMRFVS